MKKIILFLTLLPSLCTSQIICDFGIGFEAGKFRLSESQNFYESDLVRSPYMDIDTAQYFFVKAGDGATFGLSAMVACTLTTPDSRIFYTVTARPSFGLAQFQMYQPHFSMNTLTPQEEWLRDSLRPVRAGSWSIPLLAHINYNVAPERFALYLGLGVSINNMMIDRRKEFNRVATKVVTENAYYPTRLESYYAFYKFRPFAKIETQLGIIWTGIRGRQHEAYFAASIGNGRQGSVIIGYFWRFNFYKG